MKFKIGDRVKVKANGYRYDNQIGTVVDISFGSSIYVLFDNKELNDFSFREDGAFFFYEDELELYTMDQTKRNLLD